MSAVLAFVVVGTVALAVAVDVAALVEWVRGKHEL